MLEKFIDLFKYSANAWWEAAQALIELEGTELGEKKNGKLEGQGIKVYLNENDGMRIDIGDFQKGVLHGWGIRIYENGSMAAGQFKEGGDELTASFFNTGGWYQGSCDYTNDRMHGEGTWFYSKDNSLFLGTLN